MARSGNRSRLAAGCVSTLSRTHIQSLTTNQKANDQTEQSKDGTENLNDENLDEPVVRPS